MILRKFQRVSFKPNRTVIRNTNRYSCTHIPGCTVHNRRNVETMQVSTDREMKKQTMADEHSGILFSLVKEGSADTF